MHTTTGFAFITYRAGGTGAEPWGKKTFSVSHKEAETPVQVAD